MSQQWTRLRKWLSFVWTHFRKWILITIGAALTLGAVALYNPLYAGGIVATIYRSELAMLYWIEVVNLSQATAFWIAALQSTVALIAMYLLGSDIARLFEKNGARNHLVPGQFGVSSWLRYGFILIYCITPEGGPASVWYAKTRRLNMKGACGVMLMGNFAEKWMWNQFLGTIKPIMDSPWAILIWVIVGIITLMPILRILFKKLREWRAKKKQRSMSLFPNGVHL